MKSYLETLDRLGELESSLVRGRVGDSCIATIEEASSLAWIPIETNVALTEAVCELLPLERREHFFRRLILDSLETPLFATFVKSSVRLLGLDPASLVRVIGRVFNIMFRDAGTWRVHGRRSNEVILSVEGLPEACTQPFWLESVRCSLGALFDFVDRVGDVDLIELEPERGAASFWLTWR